MGNDPRPRCPEEVRQSTLFVDLLVIGTSYQTNASQFHQKGLQCRTSSIEHDTHTRGRGPSSGQLAGVQNF
jgi:hypothetical protein